MRHICNLPEDQPKNTELFYTIEILDEAIERGRQVQFRYGDYGTDKRLHLRTDSEGKIRDYLVNPYQMVATNGKYYLIGNYDKYDNSSFQKECLILWRALLCLARRASIWSSSKDRIMIKYCAFPK